MVKFIKKWDDKKKRYVSIPIFERAEPKKENVSVEPSVIRKQVALTGQVPTLPKGFTLPKVEAVDKFDKDRDDDVLEVKNVPSEQDLQIRDKGDLASGLNPLGGKEQEKKLERAKKLQTKALTLFNAQQITQDLFGEESESIANPSKIRFAGFFFNNRKDWETANRPKNKEEQKVLVDLLTPKKYGRYMMGGRILGDKFSYPFFFQTMGGLRVYGFRTEQEAEKAGYNYITSVNPKTGNPRWYDILKKPQNRRVLDLIRGVIAKQKQIDRELIDDRKDINPLYVFWIDDIMENRQKSIRRYKEKEKSDILSKLSEEEKEYIRKAREARKAKEKAKELEEADFFSPVRKTQERRNLFRKELRDASKDEDEG
jgi:hypothetical protein